jgi:hypothetical protein
MPSYLFLCVNLPGQWYTVLVSPKTKKYLPKRIDVAVNTLLIYILQSVYFEETGLSLNIIWSHSIGLRH